MPLVDGGGSPYPTVTAVMNLARVRANDTGISLAGNLLANSQPYTDVYLQAAWRWLQVKAAVAGVETFIRSTVIQGLPVAAMRDTAYECWIGWLGCGDGVDQFEQPVLPSDLILPLKVEARVTANQGAFREMKQAEDGLPAYIDPFVYDWRDDGMYYYGWQQVYDIKLRYAALRAPLVLTDPNAVVPFMFCEDALSARIVFEFANSRGATQTPQVQAMAEDAFSLISQRTDRKNQRRAIRRKPYGRHRGW